MCVWPGTDIDVVVSNQQVICTACVGAGDVQWRECESAQCTVLCTPQYWVINVQGVGGGRLAAGVASGWQPGGSAAQVVW